MAPFACLKKRSQNTVAAGFVWEKYCSGWKMHCSIVRRISRTSRLVWNFQTSRTPPETLDWLVAIAFVNQIWLLVTIKDGWLFPCLYYFVLHIAQLSLGWQCIHRYHGGWIRGQAAQCPAHKTGVFLDWMNAGQIDVISLSELNSSVLGYPHSSTSIFIS